MNIPESQVQEICVKFCEQDTVIDPSHNITLIVHLSQDPSANNGMLAINNTLLI